MYEYNTVTVSFTKLGDPFSTEEEFTNLIYNALPSDLLTQFRKSRYNIAFDTHVDPSPITVVEDGNLIQTWKGVRIKEFYNQLFESSNFKKMKSQLIKNGITISSPTFNINANSLPFPSSDINNFSYGLEMFPARPLDAGGFCVTDSEEEFLKNKKNLGTSWLYYNKPVTYTVNTKNYRCPEFDKIDWAESIVLLGCSIPYGVGLDDADCLSAQLEKLLNRPVINLSQPGASIQLSLDTSVLIKKLYGNVKAIVFVWSHHGRSVIYDIPINNVGAWNIDKHPDLAGVTHTLTTARLGIETSKMVWEGTPRVDCSWFPDTAEFLNVPLLSKIDLARDLTHPGIEATKESAKLIAELLTKQLRDL